MNSQYIMNLETEILVGDYDGSINYEWCDYKTGEWRGTIELRLAELYYFTDFVSRVLEKGWIATKYTDKGRGLYGVDFDIKLDDFDGFRVTMPMKAFDLFAQLGVECRELLDQSIQFDIAKFKDLLGKHYTMVQEERNEK